MTNEEAVRIAKDTFKKLHIEALKKGLLFTPFAFLLAPPLSIFTNKVFEYAASKAVDAEEMGVFFLYINFNTSAQGRAFMTAAQANQAAQNGGTNEQKQITEKNLKDTFRNLIRLSA